MFVKSLTTKDLATQICGMRAGEVQNICDVICE